MIFYIILNLQPTPFVVGLQVLPQGYTTWPSNFIVKPLLTLVVYVLWPPPASCTSAWKGRWGDGQGVAWPKKWGSFGKHVFLHPRVLLSLVHWTPLEFIQTFGKIHNWKKRLERTTWSQHGNWIDNFWPSFDCSYFFWKKVCQINGYAACVPEGMFQPIKRVAGVKWVFPKIMVPPNDPF